MKARKFLMLALPGVICIHIHPVFGQKPGVIYVGDPGNPDDTESPFYTTRGSVDYEFMISGVISGKDYAKMVNA